MSDLRRRSEDVLQSTCPTSSRAAQRITSRMQHRRSESASTSNSTITPTSVPRRYPLTAVPQDTSFDNDSDVSSPPSPPSSSNPPRHHRRDASPETSTSTRTPSVSPPRVPYPLDTPDRSISSVLDASRRWDSPQTPQTPGAGSSSAPSTTSPVSRTKPRFKHSSSDTPLRKESKPVQALPFPLTTMQDKYQQSGKVARVRFSDAHPRSMPKLSAATFAPPSPVRANTSPSLLPTSTPASPADSGSRSRSDSANRRQSAQVSSTAATAHGGGSWQRQVAEQMIRLSLAPASASNTSLSSNAKRNSRHSTGTRSSGEFQQVNLDPRLVKLNQPTAAPKVAPVPFPSNTKEGTVLLKQIPSTKPKTRQTRSNTTPSPKKPPFESKDKENEVQRQQHLSSFIRHAAEAEPVEVRVVKQESFDHPEAIGINAQQWRLDVVVPTPSLGIPLPRPSSSSDKGKALESAEESLEKENEGDTDEPVLRPRPRQVRRRSVRSRNSSGARSLGAALVVENSSTPDITEGVVVAPAAAAARQGSVPSLNNRLNALRQTSQNTLQTPSTPPRSSSNVSHPSSPDDSPVPSRRRLSSYAIEPSALFFAPRATPPPVAEPTTTTTMDAERAAGGVEESTATRAPRASSSLPPRHSAASFDQHSTVPTSSRPTSSYVTAPQSVMSTPRPSNSTSRPPSLHEEDVPSVGKGKGKRVFDDVEPDAAEPSGDGNGEGGVGVVMGNGLVIPPRQRLESNMTRYTDDDTIGELPVPRKRLKMSSSAHIVQTLAEAAAAQSSPDSSYEHPGSPSEQAPRGILNKSPQPGSSTEAGPSRPSSRRSQSVSFTLQAGSTREGARSPSVASTHARRPLSVGSRPLSPSQTSTRSIPLMAIISPRPASFIAVQPSSRNGGHNHQYHLREPRRYSNASRPGVFSQPQSPTSPHSMSYVQSMVANGDSPTRSAALQEQQVVENGGVGGYRGLPFQGWAFFGGFLVPFFWWIASFTRVDYDAYARDAEAGVVPKHAPI
ncbi:hypothetical protein FRB90_005406, partial [Tulasnella sp. 427]